MKLIVTGSRDYPDGKHVCDALYVFSWNKGRNIPLVIVHGACPSGADAFADAWASEWADEVVRYPADWSQGKKAGPERNRRMIDENMDADYVLAFPLGESRGTRHCMGYADYHDLVVVNLGEK